jgi:hypothetical protein
MGGCFSFLRALHVSQILVIEESPEWDPLADAANGGRTYEAWTERMSMKGEWGGNTTLQAVADAFGRPINVVSVLGSAPYLFGWPEQGVERRAARRDATTSSDDTDDAIDDSTTARRKSSIPPTQLCFLVECRLRLAQTSLA